MQTFVIDLYAGPGAGKSTLAAETFALLKHKQESVELVREYVKDWAWRGEKINRWDGFYLLAKQLRRESTLYGKVEVIVTDSPLLLTAIYEELYQPNSQLLLNAGTELIRQQAKEGIYHLPLVVERQKEYVAKGRYETEDEAKKVDKLCREFLGSFNHGYASVVTATDVINNLELYKAVGL